MPGALSVSDGWRKTDLGWRMSISQGNIGAEPCFWPLSATAPERKRLGVAEGQMLIHAYAPFGNAKAAGVTEHTWITAIDGQQPDLSGRPLLVWFRLHHELGDPVTLTVIGEGGTRREIHYKAGQWTQ